MPTLMLVPTGIGCAIGGYAGDALPSARLLAAASGCLITHPNVMNGAALYWSDPRIHYMEGWPGSLCGWELALRPVQRQRIGLLLDAGIEPELAQRQIQVAEACRATLGLEIGPVLSTDAVGPSGAGASGTGWATWNARMHCCGRASGCIAGATAMPSWPVSTRILRALSAALRRGAGCPGRSRR